MRPTVLAAAMLASASTLVHAQSNLEKLSNFKTTGTKEFTVIEQGGDKADAIKAILEKIKLPDGFSIDLYAIVPDARHMAVGTQGIVTFVGTRKTKIWAVTDRDKDRVADEVKDFAPSIDFAVPNGPCFSPEGVLYIAFFKAFNPAAGNLRELDAIAAVIIGGGSIFGGFGTVLGSLAGAAVITLIRALLSLQIITPTGSFVLPQHWVNVFIGLILIVAVVADIWVRQQGILQTLAERLGWRRRETENV